MKMRHSMMILAVAAACVVTLAACGPKAPKPVNVIFETDLGNDIDDAMAMDMLYKYMDEQRVNLLAIMINKDCGIYPAKFADIMNVWYGYEVPIGVVSDGVPGDANVVNYAQVISEMKDEAGDPLYATSDMDYESLPDAVSLYRKILAGMPDKSVKIVSVGFLTNLSRLLESGGDRFSPLGGRELVAKKVISLTTMGGFFSGRNQEFNIVNDVPASRNVFANWPTEVTTTPFEVGIQICYPGRSIEHNLDWGIPHPMRDGYLAYCPMPHDRPCWDLTAVLYAVEGEQWFGVSEPGTIEVDEEGFTTFVPSPDGKHHFLAVDPDHADAVKGRLIQILEKMPLKYQD